MASKAIAEAKPFSEDWGHKAIQAAKDGHVLVGDQVITEDGVTNTATRKGKEVQPKVSSSLSNLIREEVAKH